ncbi:MAG: hypothetical protein RL571_1514 [Pseudomonadota bacterium]|jgi:Na+/melibiose symporter-like transporter
MSRAQHSRWRFMAYGLLGLPLAMAALPVYVQIPAYYSSNLGLALASTGWVLFLARLVDTVQDPWLGRYIDRLHGGLNPWLIAGAVLLGLSFLGLWLPPVSSAYLGAWLAIMLVIAYTAHSMLSIAYLSWGARLSADEFNPNTALLGAAAWREGAGLFGVILASVIPSWILTQPAASIPSHFGHYGLGFAAILALALFALMHYAPSWQRKVSPHSSWLQLWQTMQANQGFKSLLLPYFINAISVAIPSTLALFFINDRLQAASFAGAFLATYFVAAAIGLPLWVMLAKKVGALCAWRWGMLLAILAFCSAALLGVGDDSVYLVVCIAAGLALGADLALPPVLLAQMIQHEDSPSAYFGVWTLLGKLALALSGLALPLLALLDYQPGQVAGPALAWIYAGLPCGFKLLALYLLYRIHPHTAGVNA